MKQYMKFVEKNDVWEVWNTVYNEFVGIIKLQRVGRFMHWCLLPTKEAWFSNGCLKEISKFITTLYGRKII